jgi:hypothetical protein
VQLFHVDHIKVLLDVESEHTLLLRYQARPGGHNDAGFLYWLIAL